MQARAERERDSAKQQARAQPSRMMSGCECKPDRAQPSRIRFESMPDVTPHEISLAVWDLESPLVMSHSSRMKVGAKC